MEVFCKYGCGQEAKHQLKNGEWCCSESHNSCPVNIQKNKNGNKREGKVTEVNSNSFCEYGCGNFAKYKLKNGKLCCSKSHNSCPNMRAINSNNGKGKNKGNLISIETREKQREHRKGKNYEQIYGKSKSKQIKKKITKSLKRTINKINKKYPLFSQIEEMRYNPDKPGEKEIQVHCKNHNCSNSKEQGGWFTPTGRQIENRLYELEVAGNDNSYFYCCDECKNECPLYRLKVDPFKNNEKYYTQEEYQQFREHVLKRDNYICQYCGEKAEHVHHERPQKLDPFFSLDPDYSISVCSECHYKYCHKDECSTGNLANKICNGA